MTRPVVALVAVLLGTLALLPAAPAAAQEDAAGLADHPLLDRFPGAWIRSGVTRSGEYRLALGPPVGYPRRPEESELLDGEVSHLVYGIASGTDAETVYLSYREALDAAGFDVLYACSREACGSGGAWAQVLGEPYASGPRETMHYLAARLGGSGSGRTSVALFVAGGGAFEVVVSLDVVEEDGGGTVPIAVGAPTAPASAVDAAASRLNEQIGAAGKVEVYGIEFDMGATAVREDSRPTLETIAALLAANPELALYVVGHTDDTGPQGLNLSLSKGRAQAVVDVLVRDYGVAAGRLSAHGLGPFAPVASNRTDEGRARNRRVELVERYATP